MSSSNRTLRPASPSEAAPATAKLFVSGRSQAVQLPEPYRFSGTKVRIRRERDAVILEPMRKRGWPRGYWERLDLLRQGLDVDCLARPPDTPPAPLGFDLDEEL